MKKLLIAFSAVALILGITSCNKKNSDAASPLSDSLTVSLGKAYGGGFAYDFKNYVKSLPESEQKKFSSKSVLKGLQQILAADTADKGYLIGLQMGMQLDYQISVAQAQGAAIDRTKVMKYKTAAFSTDSLPDLTPEFQTLQYLQSKLQQEYLAREEQKLMETPEAIENGKSGEAFVNKEKKNDSQIKTTASGLSYKIENPGDSGEITEKDRVQIKYTGRLIDGKIFDSIPSDETRTLLVSNFVPGFKEGLMLLKKGGKARLYIPGNLGYGGKGQPGAGIGPNSTLVFDVEVVDINPRPKSK